MVNPIVRMLASDISHMPLHFVWRDSGVTQRHGFVANNPEVNFIGPFDIWDTSYLRGIDDSDYIDELYGGSREAQNPMVTVAI